jgi:hypothetical protein
MTRTCRGADRPWQVRGSRVGRLAAIGEHLLFVGKNALGQPNQHMRAACPNGLHQGCRNEAAIHQHQHAGFECGQQPTRQAGFGRLAGSGNDLDDSMGAGFDQVEAAQLGIGTAGLPFADARHPYWALAAVSLTSSRVPSMAISRKPKAKAPGVSALASGTQKCSTRARSSRTPICLRAIASRQRASAAALAPPRPASAGRDFA